MYLEHNLRTVKSVKTILTENRKKVERMINIVFYGSMALVLLSGIIKFILSK